MGELPDLSDLVGKKFAFGGRGPDQYDCYGLLMEVYRRKGVEILDFQSPTDWRQIAVKMRENIHLWTPCDQVPGAAMYMKIASAPHHVGVYVGVGWFIHTHEGAGQVVIDHLRHWEKKVVGYYQYAG